jgi:hypothetical protein
MAAESEHKEQVALFRWAEFAAARRPELRLLYAIPNGGHRHKAVAARMKAEGVRRGVLDVCLPVARVPYHGLYIEMKTRRGTVSADQKRWIQSLRSQGYRAEVCRGWSAARELIEQHLDGGAWGPPPFGNVEAPGEGTIHEHRS